MALSYRSSRAAVSPANASHLGGVSTVRPALQRLRGSSRSNQLPVARVIEVEEADFESVVLKSDQTVLVDYWATWCGPCKLIAPLMIWAEKEYQGSLKVVKVNVTDRNKSLVEKYKIYGLPALILYRNGEMIEGTKNEGAINKSGLAQYLAANGVAAVPVSK